MNIDIIAIICNNKLNIDGVLNSAVYDKNKSESDGNIDISRLVLIKALVDRTGASVVLSSSWRCHWDPLGEETDEIGSELEGVFNQCGIELFDRTPLLGGNRSKEIRAWLSGREDIESFVIIDDIKFGWGELDDYVVKTDYRIGRALEQIHIDKSIKVLTQVE